jgi:hypothetical protein
MLVAIPILFVGAGVFQICVVADSNQIYSSNSCELDVGRFGQRVISYSVEDGETP